MRHWIQKHKNIMVILVAALLLELTAAVMYWTAQHIIADTMQRLVRTEMNAIYLCIRNKLAKVEVTVDNAAWVVSDNLEDPDEMFHIAEQIVDNNAVLIGSGVSFMPDYYPSKGRYFEPYAARREGDSIVTMQLGSVEHDYTQLPYFQYTIAKEHGNWCEPYEDNKGAQTIVTTYSVPVYDYDDEVVAVAAADIALNWLEDILGESKQYQSTQRFLMTGSRHLLAGEDNRLYQHALMKLDADKDGDGYVTAHDAKGNKLHVFLHEVGGRTDWLIVSVVRDDEVFGTLNDVRIALGLLIFVGLVLAVVIVIRSTRNEEQLQRAQAEQERTEGELRVASEIQRMMLPKEVKGERLRVNDVEVKGYLKPAREVGGDIYDYAIRDEKLYFCIGDVSGKGAAAAMLMAVAHTLFRTTIARESNPVRIMQSLNQTLSDGNERNMFLTLFIGVLDLPTGRLRYCNAGHDTPIVGFKDSKIQDSRIQDSKIQDSKFKIQRLPCDANLPVGVFADTQFTLQETQLSAGSMLFLYTDGLTEAKNKRHEQFGLDRVEQVISGQVISGQTIESCAQLLETMTAAVQRFVGEAEQSDDLTMLLIRYTPQQFQGHLTERLTLKNNTREVKRLSAFLKEVTERLGIEKTLAGQLRLAVEEAVVNVIDYAYAEGIEGTIDLLMQSDGKTLRVQITDSGVPFDPTAKERTDTTLSAEDRQMGGLGILLVRSLMDSINYERENGKNILTLTKTIS